MVGVGRGGAMELGNNRTVAVLALPTMLPIEACYMLTTTSQPPNARTKDKAATTRKFSTFIKRMIVELDRDPSTYAEGNVVEVSASSRTLAECIEPDAC